MRNNIRWMLTEAKISDLNPDEINIEGNKLICYHLTSHSKWTSHDNEASRIYNKRFDDVPEKEILDTDSRTDKILKRLSNSQRGIKKNDNPFNVIDKYHSTRDQNIKDLEEFIIMNMIDDPYTNTSGFTAGSGDFHGKGLYTCYKFNPKIAKTYGNICLVFEIDISRFLICSEDVAKQVHGENWTIKDQLAKLYSSRQNDPKKVQEYIKLLEVFNDNDFAMSTDINSTERTSDISQALIGFFGKDNITSLYDGIILFGRGDGPVCVSFYPKYDSKLIGLGRLDKKKSDVVDWYDSINDFVGGSARNKLDFETMNDIAEENSDKLELSQSKESERKKFDPDDQSVKNLFDSRDITKVLAFYEIGSKDIKDKIENHFVEKSVWFSSGYRHPTEFKGSKSINTMFLNIITKLKTSGSKNEISKESLYNLILDFARSKTNLSSELIKFCLNFVFGGSLSKKFPTMPDIVTRTQDECILVCKDYIEVNSLDKELEKIINDKFDIGGKSAEGIFKTRVNDIQNYYITSRKLSEFIESINANPFLARVKNSLSISDLKKFILSLLRYYTNSKRKMPAKVSNFILTNVHYKDIVLSKQEQDNWANKIGKSHHYVKKMFSSYKHVDPDVLIKLIEPDLKKGGMGSGIVYSDFYKTYNIYNLLYKHKSVVDLFARSGKSGMMREIIKSITNSLRGETVEVLNNIIPQDDGDVSDSNPVHDLNSIIDLNNSQWFNYFLNTMRTSSSIKMLRKPLNELEKVMKDKGMMIDSQVEKNNLDLSHKIIIGKTLKEVYNF